MKYSYYEKEGAIFRQKEGFAGVADIKAGNQWEPYAGDRLAAAYFGSLISAAEAGEEFQAAAE